MRLRAERDGSAHGDLRGIGGWPTGARDYGRKDGEEEQGESSADAWGATLAGVAQTETVPVRRRARELVDEGEFRLKRERKF